MEHEICDICLKEFDKCKLRHLPCNVNICEDCLRVRELILQSLIVDKNSENNK